MDGNHILDNYSSPCDDHLPYKQPPCDEQPLHITQSHILLYKFTLTSTHTLLSNLFMSTEWGVAYSRDYCIKHCNKYC